MAELVTVARPYAEATFKAGLEANQLAEYANGVQMAAAIANDSAMSALLHDPKVSSAQKLEMFSAVAGNVMPEGVKTLVKILLDGQRATLLPSIAEQFDALKRKHDGVVNAQITSAFPMSDADTADLVNALAKKYGKKVIATVAVDASLIGGARVQVGDEVVQASVRDTLNQMAVSLVH